MNRFTAEDTEDICEECLEYICHHKYPRLKLDGECSICFETLTSNNTVILDNCNHCFTESCIVVLSTNGRIKCPLCTQISAGYKKYVDLKIELCNSIIPPIGIIPFENYSKLFNKYKHCIYPTKEMIKYMEDGQELYDGILIKRTLNKEKEKLFCKKILKI